MRVVDSVFMQCQKSSVEHLDTQVTAVAAVATMRPAGSVKTVINTHGAGYRMVSYNKIA